MSYKKCLKPTKDELANLLKTQTNDEAAITLGVGRRTIQRWRDSYGLSQETVHTGGVSTLTKHQKDLITGWMLGDGSVRWKPKGQKNMFSFKQMQKRREYVQFVFETLKPFARGKVKDSQPKKGPIQTNGKITQNVSETMVVESNMYTCSSNVFVEMRKQWYEKPYVKKSQKIVPDLNLNWKIFSYWFADDGNNNGTKRTISLATQSFTEGDVDRLIFWLDRDLGVKATRKNYGGPIIVIGSAYYDLVIGKLRQHLAHLKCLESKLQEAKPHDYKTYESSLTDLQIEQIWSDRLALVPVSELCDKYKISKATLYRVLKKKSLVDDHAFPKGRKLTHNQIEQIVEDWNNGLSQSKIAEKHEVAQTMISFIIRRKSHQEITDKMWIRGHTNADTAIVSVDYNIKT